jgi:hypothetical protein
MSVVCVSEGVSEGVMEGGRGGLHECGVCVCVYVCEGVREGLHECGMCVSVSVYLCVSV